jgi:hypothetical protein
MNPESRKQLESLIATAKPFAEKMLIENGEFFPFGAAVDKNGKLLHVAGYNGDERALSADLIVIINDGFRQSVKSGDYIATALVYDVRIIPPGKNDKSDAVAIALDNPNDSLIVYFPYLLKDSDLIFGEQFACKGDNSIFA